MYAMMLGALITTRDSRMAVFNVGEFTVHPGVTGRDDIWSGHFSITTPDGRGGTARFGVTEVPGTFATEDEAMEAARVAGRHAANHLAAQAYIEPYRDDD